MKLQSDSCTVLIQDNVVVCEYKHLFGIKAKWSLRLTDEALEYRDSSKQITISNENVNELAFEIQTNVSMPDAWALTPVAVAYVIRNDSQEPQELFRLCVEEERKLATKTESYLFAEQIVKFLANELSKPYTFQHSIDTNSKKNQVYLGLILPLFMVIIGMLLVFSVLLKN